MANFPRGRFVWHEVYPNDTAAARQFYQRVMGWSVQGMPTEGEEYTMWMNGEVPVGGMMQLPEQARQMGAQPHWLGYISTPDVDATWAEAQKRGATNIMGPYTAPTVGRWVILKDPQGALVAFFKGEQQPSSGPVQAPAIGEFSWHELATTDLDAATRFYADLFGWETTDFDMGEFGVYRIFLVDGQQTGGIFRKPDNMPAPPHWLHYTRVDSADAGAARVTDAGGRILNGPMDVPGGDRIVQCMDPQGAAFALQSRAGGAA